jgi:hypothetical protein
MNGLQKRDIINVKNKHDIYAPYWAVALIMIGGIGVSTIWIELGDFWNGYVLDMTGPAWNYILFRGLFTSQANNAWTRFFYTYTNFINFSYCLFWHRILTIFRFIRFNV